MFLVGAGAGLAIPRGVRLFFAPPPVDHIDAILCGIGVVFLLASVLLWFWGDLCFGFCVIRRYRQDISGALRDTWGDANELGTTAGAKTHINKIRGAFARIQVIVAEADKDGEFGEPLRVQGQTCGDVPVGLLFRNRHSPAAEARVGDIITARGRLREYAHRAYGPHLLFDRCRVESTKAIETLPVAEPAIDPGLPGQWFGNRFVLDSPELLLFLAKEWAPDHMDAGVYEQEQFAFAEPNALADIEYRIACKKPGAATIGLCKPGGQAIANLYRQGRTEVVLDQNRQFTYVLHWDGETDFDVRLWLRGWTQAEP